VRGAECLFESISLDKCRVLNAKDPLVLRSILRSHEKRAERCDKLESDDDDSQLIVFVQFSSVVRVKSVTVCGDSADTSPKNLKCFINRDDIDFSNVNDATPVQEFELIDDVSCQPNAEYKTKLAKWQRVESVTLFFDGNFAGDGSTVLTFLGFRGEFVEKLWNRAPVIAVYESRPMPDDHKLPSTNMPKYEQ
jgi:hypothetical protein